MQAPPKDFGNVWFSFRNPDGDPVNAPDSTSMVGVNEFTFDDSHPGELRIHLISEVYPDEIRPYFPGNLISYTVDGIAGSDLSYSSIIWYPPYTYYSCYAYFEGLPASNSAFGRKTARMFYKGGFLKAHDYEVFFPKNANNHPTCSTCENCPNWFYYWRQLSNYNQNKIQYVPTINVLGRVPAMKNWSYEHSIDKQLIYIGNNHPASGKQYSIGESFSGIDCFMATIIHEQKHVDQIQRADQYLWNSCGETNLNNTLFRYGWSWNKIQHNHWAKGPDGAWGKANVDDDSDGFEDNARAIPLATNPPFEPGQYDDENLTSSRYNDWPKSWLSLPGIPYINMKEGLIEGEAVQAADNAMDEHKYARHDWGNPGKNHGTKDKWDD